MAIIGTPFVLANRIELPSYSMPSTFTFSAWINPADVAGGNFLDFWGSSIFIQRINTTSYVLEAVHAGVSVFGTSSGAVSKNVWSNVIFTYDGTNWAWYINGSASGSGSNAQTITGTTTYFFTEDSSTRFFNGSLGEYGIWNVILSTGEIAAIGKGAIPSTIRPASLVSYWTLGSTATSFPDLSGNKKNGSIVGTMTLAPSNPPVAMFTPRSPMSGIVIGGPSAAQIYSFDQVGAHITRKITSLGY